jgi:hypothetical protein
VRSLQQQEAGVVAIEKIGQQLTAMHSTHARTGNRYTSKMWQTAPMDSLSGPRQRSAFGSILDLCGPPVSLPYGLAQCVSPLLCACSEAGRGPPARDRVAGAPGEGGPRRRAQGPEGRRGRAGRRGTTAAQGKTHV